MTSQPSVRFGPIAIAHNRKRWHVEPYKIRGLSQPTRGRLIGPETEFEWSDDDLEMDYAAACRVCAEHNAWLRATRPVHEKIQDAQDSLTYWTERASHLEHTLQRILIDRRLARQAIADFLVELQALGNESLATEKPQREFP